uniref:HVA22-like protein n=1 Tax=Populus davidiana TaxID=266767 RepID=A0A6M2EXZ9_9ROSI
MGRFWTFLTHVHTLSGPVMMLLYPLYASVIAIESPSREDDEQWLAYWILYSFLTLTEMLLQSILEWIPIWYSLKLVVAAWLVLPQFKGAAFIYERFVREHIKKYIGEKDHPHPHHKSTTASSGGGGGSGGGKAKNKFVHFISPNKGEHEVY